MSLAALFWLTLAGGGIAFWWQSDRIKQQVLQQVSLACQRQGLQLLDQTMVIRDIRPQRALDGNWVLRRRYQFEFSSTGAVRYRGEVVVVGAQLSSLDLEPHVLPDSESSHDRLH